MRGAGKIGWREGNRFSTLEVILFIRIDTDLFRAVARQLANLFQMVFLAFYATTSVKLAL
jgi:hypothetical protein